MALNHGIGQLNHGFLGAPSHGLKFVSTRPWTPEGRVSWGKIHLRHRWSKRSLLFVHVQVVIWVVKRQAWSSAKKLLSRASFDSLGEPLLFWFLGASFSMLTQGMGERA